MNHVSVTLTVISLFAICTFKAAEIPQHQHERAYSFSAGIDPFQERRSSIRIRSHSAPPIVSIYEMIEMPSYSQNTDRKVFESLWMLMQNVQSPKPFAKMVITFLSHSLQEDNCSVNTLCTKFNQTFKCDTNGILTTLNLNQRFKMHHLDLMTIPDSVQRLRMEGNNLQSISKWRDLRGKSLHSLLLCTRGHNGNGHLMLNLTELGKSWNLQIKIPLKHLQVSRGHIAAYFGISGKTTYRMISNIRTWTKRSILESLRVLQGQQCDPKMFVFDTDGRVMISKKECENMVILH